MTLVAGRLARSNRWAHALVIVLMAGDGVAAAWPAGPEPEAAPREPQVSGYRKLGPFFYAPALRIKDFGYDDNVFLSGEGREGDLLLTAGPELRAVLRMGPRAWAVVHGSADFTGYARHSSINHFDNDHGAEINGWIGDLRITGAWEEAHDLRRPSFEVDERVRRDERSLRGALLYELSPATSLELGLTSYEEHHGDAGGVDYDALLGHEDLIWSLSGRHRVGPATIAVVELSDTDRDGAALSRARDLRRTQALGGFDFERGALAQGTVRLGVVSIRAADPPSEDGQDFRGVAGRGDLEIRAGTRSRVKLDFRREFSPSTYRDNVYFRNDTAELSFIRELSARLAGEVGGARGWIAYPDLDPDRRRDRIAEWFAGMRIRLGSRAELRIRAGIWTRESSLDGEERRRFVIRQSVTLPL